jgi:hypothetical protein
MAQERPYHMKAINTTFTPPEEDIRNPEPVLPSRPVHEVVPIVETPHRTPRTPDRDRAGSNPDNAPGSAAARPGMQAPQSDA